MSYRSHVAYMIVGPRDKLLAELMKLRLPGTRGIREALDEITVNAFDDTQGRGGSAAATTYAAIYFEAQDVKWDDGFSSVAGHTALWKHFANLSLDRNDITGSAEDLDEHDLFRRRLQGRFLRQGEGTDDTEENDFGDDSLYDYLLFVRSVSTYFDIDRANDLRQALPLEGMD